MREVVLEAAVEADVAREFALQPRRTCPRARSRRCRARRAGSRGAGSDRASRRSSTRKPFCPTSRDTMPITGTPTQVRQPEAGSAECFLVGFFARRGRSFAEPVGDEPVALGRPLVVIDTVQDADRRSSCARADSGSMPPPSGGCWISLRIGRADTVETPSANRMPCKQEVDAGLRASSS